MLHERFEPNPTHLVPRTPYPVPRTPYLPPYPYACVILLNSPHTPHPTHPPVAAAWCMLYNTRAVHQMHVAEIIAKHHETLG